MPISSMSAIERIARVLAGQRASVNGDGEQASASADVEASWGDHVEEAVAVLKTLREPDAAMAEAGSAETWEAMIMAALKGAV